MPGNLPSIGGARNDEYLVVRSILRLCDSEDFSGSKGQFCIVFARILPPPVAHLGEIVVGEMDWDELGTVEYDRYQRRDQEPRRAGI